MKRTGLTIVGVGVIQLMFSTLALIYLSQLSGTSFSHYWDASGMVIWYPQFVAGITLVIVGLAVAFIVPRLGRSEPESP